MAARARAESFLFALPKGEWPEEFDDHPIMAEALSLETHAHEVYDRIVSTSASTLEGAFAPSLIGAKASLRSPMPSSPTYCAC